MAKKGRFYDLEPTPRNFRVIYDLLHKLDDGHVANLDIITRQQALIDSLTTQLATTAQNTQQALILAGKAASQTSTGVAPAPGGGGGSGGGVNIHPDYLNQVAAAKADLIAAGDTLEGADGSWRIVNRAVQYININAGDLGAGLLSKTTGNNSGGYSVDIICFTDGAYFDVLIGAGDIYNPTVVGANTPAWNFKGIGNAGLWRPAV